MNIQSPTSPAKDTTPASSKEIHGQIVELGDRIEVIRCAARGLAALTRAVEAQYVSDPIGWLAEELEDKLDILNRDYIALTDASRRASGYRPAEDPAPARAVPSWNDGLLGDGAAQPRAPGMPADDSDVVALAKDWHNARSRMDAAEILVPPGVQDQLAHIEGRLLRNSPMTREGVSAMLGVAYAIAADRAKDRDSWLADGPAAALMGRALDGIDYLRNPDCS